MSISDLFRYLVIKEWPETAKPMNLIESPSIVPLHSRAGSMDLG